MGTEGYLREPLNGGVRGHRQVGVGLVFKNFLGIFCILKKAFMSVGYYSVKNFLGIFCISILGPLYIKNFLGEKSDCFFRGGLL